ncbi:hypothetical protein R1sor_018104 [Riccia sorocarpa]|uniref:Caffeoyl-CoA O-methyltransferase n=1 Tax=Riccia sorocarpa TaxID=122646 RepID=A0ABD3I8W6_9MARC
MLSTSSFGMHTGLITMTGNAKACLWRGITNVWHGSSRSKVCRLQPDGYQQQRSFRLQISADRGNVESGIPATPKAIEADGGERLFQYVQAQVREPEILRTLRQETSKMRGGVMQVTPDQGQFLAMLARLLGAEKCIEVGVFTGYSALAVAMVLPDSGCLVACDRSEESLAIAERYFRLAGVSQKVDVRLGMAVDTLKELLAQGDAGRYDMAFLDADKRMYPEYYELLLQLVRPGGLVIVDNVLWHGTVADSSVMDTKTQSIRDFNDFLLNDDRIDYSLVTVGDGMSLCRKR